MSKVTQRQKDLLADFMSENYTILFGKFVGGQGKHLKKNKWEEITTTLNSNGPPTKDVEKWKRTWADIKMNVKEKVKLIRQHRNRTGGGPSSTLSLTPFEEKIKSICGNTLMDGDPAVKEIGFNETLNEESSDSGTVMIGASQISDSLKVIDESQATSVLQTPSKSSNAPVSKPTPKRFNFQQNQVDNALELQREANALLKRIVFQNDEMLSNHVKIISLLEKSLKN